MVQSDGFWKPSKDTRSAISRGDRKLKEATDRSAAEAERERREKRERKAWDLDVPF